MNATSGEADAFRAFEVTGWEQVGKPEAYHRFLGQVTRLVTDPLLDAVAAGPGSRLLDVGSGPGYLAAAAAARGASAIGVDAAQRMLALAARLHPEVEFRPADAEALPFPDRSFDAVVANFLLPHLARPEVALTEFTRVLRPGGRLALTTWGLARGSYLGLYAEAIQAAGALPPPGLPAGPSFFAFADEAAFAGLLQAAGLQDPDVQSLTVVHPATQPGDIWEGLLSGTVRNAAFIQAQPAAIQERIRQAFEQRLRTARAGETLKLPVDVKLARGRKASDH